jgi:hypothetical protein
MPDTRKRDTSKTRPAIFLGRSAAGKNRVEILVSYLTTPTALVIIKAEGLEPIAPR